MRQLKQRPGGKQRAQRPAPKRQRKPAHKVGARKGHREDRHERRRQRQLFGDQAHLPQLEVRHRQVAQKNVQHEQTNEHPTDVGGKGASSRWLWHASIITQGRRNSGDGRWAWCHPNRPPVRIIYGEGSGREELPPGITKGQAPKLPIVAADSALAVGRGFG